MAAQIKNIFVLLLENRSFDHMLGFSGISGVDAESGGQTRINGLQGAESNAYQGATYTVAANATDPLPVDPGHEFLDVLEQLCGATAAFTSGQPYPPINNSGFVSDYAVSHTRDEGNATGDHGRIMSCFAPADLPVLKALAAVPPGDTAPGSKYNQYGFNFDRYGVRVPAVVVSPFIPANTIDHRLYDHSSIPATFEAAFGMAALTERDRAARSALSLLSLTNARNDAPSVLPTPAAAISRTADLASAPTALPQGTVDSGNLPEFLQVAMRHDIALSPSSQTHDILSRVQAIQTRAQAAQYIAEVGTRARAARAATARG